MVFEEFTKPSLSWLIVTVLVVSGCLQEEEQLLNERGKSTTSDEPVVVDPVDPDTPPAEPIPDPIVVEGPITWDNFTQAFLATHCVACHGDVEVDSGIKGKHLGDFDDAKGIGTLLLASTEGGAMPPQGGLSEEDLAKFKYWVETGMPRDLDELLPSITLSGLADGGVAVKGAADITWTTTNPQSATLAVNLELSMDEGTSFTSLADSEADDGSYSWDISSLTEGDTYLIKATVTDGTNNKSAISAAAITISEQIYKFDSDVTEESIMDLVMIPNCSGCHTTMSNGGFNWSTWAQAEPSKTRIVIRANDAANPMPDGGPLIDEVLRIKLKIWELQGFPQGTAP